MLSSMASNKQANILLVGGGAVGTIVALNIESGGLGAVTAVLRSNFSTVQKQGYTIKSVDHGKIKGWRPTAGKRILLFKFEVHRH